MYIPPEIRLNILEYGTTQYSLNVSDKLLIQHIQQYEPTFSVDEWRKSIQRRYELINSILTSEWVNIYNIIRYGIVILFEFSTLISIRTKKKEHINELIQLLAKVGCECDREIKYRDDYFECTFQPDNRDMVQTNLTIVWMLKDPERNIYPYNDTRRYIVHRIGIVDLMEKINLLEIPTSLVSYLQRISSKRCNTPMHRLYQLLNSFTWKLEIFSDKILVIRHVSYDNHLQLVEKINNIIPIKKYRYDYRLWIKFKQNISELLDIDRFYHPYLPWSISTFRPSNSSITIF